MLSFDFLAPQKIVFGTGRFNTVGELIGPLGRSVLLVASRSFMTSERYTPFLDRFAGKGIKVSVFGGVTGEPTPDIVGEAIELGKRHDCDLVMGIGGGSVIDTAKAASGMIVNEGSLIDYIEGVGIGRVMEHHPLPLIAVPTTAGTGAEVTKNAVISSQEMGFKRSFRDDRLLPTIALVDPELTLSAPPKVTAYAGMDALTQLIESYTSKKAKPMTDALALSGLERVARSLKKAFDHGGNIEARTDLSYGSMLSGLCLANSGLGAAHGIAAAFGAVCGVPHGMACAVLLPYVMQINAPYVGRKIDTLSQVLTGQSYTRTKDNVTAVVECIKALSQDLDIPPDFKSFNIKRDMAQKLTDSCSTSSLSGNPKELSKEEIQNLIECLI